MCLDALTISGVMAALISAALLVAIVCHNDPFQNKL